MEKLTEKLQELREKWGRYWRESMSEIQTRLVFVDPILIALGWDIHDPEQVRVEVPIGGGRTISYALKDKGRNILFIKAFSLENPLNDPNLITQVVQDTAANNIKWCAITNGVIWKFYSSMESCPILDRLLYEINYNTGDQDLNKTSMLFEPFSRSEMQKGELDKLWDKLFTDSRIRRAMNKLIANPPDCLIEAIRASLPGISLMDTRIKESLLRLWKITQDDLSTGQMIPARVEEPKRYTREDEKQEEETQGYSEEDDTSGLRTRAHRRYDEQHHIEKRKSSVIDLYKEIDRFCFNLNPRVYKTYRALYITWEIDQMVFCNLHIHSNKIRGWLHMPWSDVVEGKGFLRNVKDVKHWGSGDLEFNISAREELDILLKYIKMSFDNISKRTVLHVNELEPFKPIEIAPPVKRKRGRPRKIRPEEVQQVVKRKRGRPPLSAAKHIARMNEEGKLNENKPKPQPIDYKPLFVGSKSPFNLFNTEETKPEEAEETHDNIIIQEINLDDDPQLNEDKSLDEIDDDLEKES